MKAALKFIMTLVGLLLIAINIGVLLLITRFEGLLREGLTHQASQILNAEVHLEAVRIDWTEQALVFKGVSVFNPEGFTDREAIRIDALQVRPDLLTVFSKTPALREIVLHAAEVHLQYKPDAGTNLGAMMEQARQWSDQQVDGEKRVWGRPMSVAQMRSDTVALRVRSVEPASPELPLTLDAFAVDDPGKGQAVTGAGIIHLVIQNLMHRLTSLDGLSGPVQELLAGESDLEAA